MVKGHRLIRFERDHGVGLPRVVVELRLQHPGRQDLHHGPDLAAAQAKVWQIECQIDNV